MSRAERQGKIAVSVAGRADASDASDQDFGGDAVEVAPQYDATTNTAQAAAQMLFEVVALIALARRQRA